MKKIILPIVVATAFLCTTACDEKKEEKGKQKESSEHLSEPASNLKELSDNVSNEISNDPHSFSNPEEVGTKHIHLDLDIDFNNKVINGIARLDLVHRNNQGKFVFDANGLVLAKVLLDGKEEVNIKMVAQDELLGIGYEVPVTPETEFVEIHYQTTTKSDALQWLNPDQTAGKKHPYLFTQGQAILTRTWIPCQVPKRINGCYECE